MRKNLKNNAENVWRLCFIALLLHPHSRENGDTEIMKQIFLEKSSEIIWRLKKKSLPLQPQSRNDSERVL